MDVTQLSLLLVFSTSAVVGLPLGWIAYAQRRRRLNLAALHAEHQALIESLSEMQEGLFVIENGRIVQVNRVICELLGRTEQEMLDWPSYIELFHPEERERIAGNHRRRLAGERIESRYESAFLHRSGRRVEIDFAAARLVTDKAVRIVAVARDITRRRQNELQLRQANERLAQEIEHRRQAEASLKASEHQLRTIADNLPILIGYVDRELRYLFNNSTYFDWFGVAPAQLTGRSMQELIGEELFGRVEPICRRVLAGERASYEVRTVIAGVPRYTQVTYIPDQNDAGAVLGFFVMVQDITERKEHELFLQEQALHDGLTGLLNRVGLMGRLERAIAHCERHGEPLAVLFLDLDGFKSVNDRLGHEAGDRLLQAMADRLVAAVRMTDTVARLGGDEFIILLEGIASPEAVGAVAGKIIDVAAVPFELSGQPMTVTVSVGAVVYCGGPVEPEQLLSRADQAMYQAKHAGKNTYRILSDSSAA